MQVDHEEVLSFTQPSDAFGVLKSREDINSIILDLHVDNIDWWSLHQNLREFGQDMGRIPSIVGLSSHYVHEESEQVCQAFQLDAYQMLPVEPQQLRQCIQDLVALRKKCQPLCEILVS